MKNEHRPCIDCGAQIHRTSYRCRPCAQIETRAYKAAGARRRPRRPMPPEIRAQLSAKAARKRSERAELIEEYLSFGIDGDRIAADFHVTRKSLARMLYRDGRPALAAKVRAA